MESIIDTYARTICVNCKNRNTDLCEVRKTVDNTFRCIYYEKEKENKGYEKFKGRIADQQKPIMKGIS